MFGSLLGSLVSSLLAVSPAHAGVAEVRLEVQRCIIRFEQNEQETLWCFANGAQQLMPYLRGQLGRDFDAWRRRTEDACEAQVFDEGGTRVQQDLKGVRCIYQAAVREIGE